jgi:hypothetical protein
MTKGVCKQGKGKEEWGCERCEQRGWPRAVTKGEPYTRVINVYVKKGSAKVQDNEKECKGAYGRRFAATNFSNSGRENGLTSARVF